MPETERPGQRRVAISCAFEENAIRSIARRAHAQGILSVRALRDPSPLLNGASRVNDLLRRPSRLNSYITKYAAKVGRDALPEDQHLSAVSEILRVAGGRFRTPLSHRVGNATWKIAFDHAAHRVDFGHADTLISMAGSSLETFRSNPDRRLVLHEIDAHPRTRNDLLEQFFGKTRARAEMYPESFVARIEAEIELADRVLVPGSVVGDQMRQHGVEDSKIVTVPYGVDPSIFRPMPSNAHTPQDRLQVVFTGQVCLRKGVPHLLEAVRNQPIDVTIVGQVFDTRIVEHLPSNVTLAGILSASDLAALYSRMDVFVLPSIEDCFALVVAEAAAAGLPVVTTRENGSHELLSHRHTVIDAGDVPSLRDALLSHQQLTWKERCTISEEALTSGWTDWDTYGDTALKAVMA